MGLTGNSSAGNGTFIANGGQVAGASGGHIYVQNFSSGEKGTFYVNGTTVDGAFGGGVTFTIESPTAATATLIATGGVGTGEGDRAAPLNCTHVFRPSDAFELLLTRQGSLRRL